MIIHKPEVIFKDDKVILSARVEFEKLQIQKPESAWFSFPEKYAPFVSDRGDAFAASMLPIAMAVNEGIQMESPLSPLLACGLGEYQSALKNWFPDELHVVPINAAAYEHVPESLADKSCAALFSGGVDSSFTMRMHLPEYQPLSDFQVQYGIFVQGFDIALQDQKFYDAYLQAFSNQLAPKGVRIVPCRTNLHYFSSGLLNWGIAHGGMLAGVGLALDKLIRYFLIPSSYSLEELIPWGSTPMTDHWLSTETFKVIHHGVTFSRIEKVEAIADWEPAQHILRVCINEKERREMQNCSHCEKCLRTMTMLEVCQALGRFHTFQAPFSWAQIMRWTPNYDAGEVWLPQVLEYARSKGRKKYIFPLYIAHLRGRAMRIIRRLTPRPLFLQLKRKLFPYESNSFNPKYLE